MNWANQERCSFLMTSTKTEPFFKVAIFPINRAVQRWDDQFSALFKHIINLWGVLLKFSIWAWRLKAEKKYHGFLTVFSFYFFSGTLQMKQRRQARGHFPRHGKKLDEYWWLLTIHLCFPPFWLKTLITQKALRLHMYYIHICVRAKSVVEFLDPNLASSNFKLFS